MRRSALALLVLLLLAAGAAFADEPCRFIVMGDNRPPWDNPDTVTPSVGYQRAALEANLLQPEFVVIGGDLVRGYTSLEKMEQQWEAFDAATKQFRMPVYLVVGNHDVFNQATEQLYQRRYGKLWYSLDVKHCHLVVLDSEDQTAPGKIAGAQLEWLQADLAAARGKRIFVVLHQPLWPREERAFRESEWGKTVHPLLLQAGVDTVFAGHEHTYQQTPTRDGIRYIITGGGGAELGEQAEPLAGGFLHYVLVTAPSDAPATLAVIHTGGVDPEDVVTTEKARQVTQFQRQFRTGRLLLEDRPVRQTVSFRLSNPFPQPITGTVRFDSARGWTASPASRTFALPVAGKLTLTFDLTADPQQVTGALPYHLAYQVPGRGAGSTDYRVGLTRTVFAAPKTVTLDGSLAEWTGPAPVVLERQEQLWDEGESWKGPQGLSAQAWVGRDREHLYLAVKVKDPQFTPTPPNSGSARGDSVALYLDGRAPREVGRRAYTPEVGQMIFAPGAPGEPVQIFTPGRKDRASAGLQAASQRTPDGYTMEISVPLRTFPTRGKVLGFDLSVTDNSTPNAPLVLFWHGNATDWKDASLFGRLRVEK